MKTLLKNGKVYSNGVFTESDIAVSDGIIAAVSADISGAGFDSVIDIRGYYAVPGFTDVHVHLREPGFSYKETVKTGTLAAAHGGYTRVCSMPNLNPAPDSPETLSAELSLIYRDALIEVMPYGCITRGEKGQELSDIEGIAGLVCGFSDDGKGVQSREMMRKAMLRVRDCGAFIAAHCEDEALLNGGYIHQGRYAAQHSHKGICSESEWRPIKRDLELVRETGCRYHVCHISAKESVNLIREAKREGLPVTCETGPHYLVLCEDDLREEGRFKMNPPLRSREDKQALLEGITDGTIDCIATDHAPHTAEEKSRGLKDSLMGVVGLETSFAVLNTALVNSGLITLERLVELMSINPARLLGKDSELRAGNKANIAVLDISAEYIIDPAKFLSMGRSTPFEGMPVRGENVLTIYEGKTVWCREGLKA